NFLRVSIRVIKKAPPIPNKATVLPSGTEVEAEKENTVGEPAPGSCVEKRNMPGVDVKPFPEANPVPVTRAKPLTPGVPPWTAVEEVRLNVNPSTDQKLVTAPELNNQGE